MEQWVARLLHWFELRAEVQFDADVPNSAFAVSIVFNFGAAFLPRIESEEEKEI